MFFPFDKKYDRVLETRYSKWRQNVTNGERDLAFFASALAGYFNGDQKKIYDHVILYEDISRDPGLVHRLTKCQVHVKRWQINFCRWRPYKDLQRSVYLPGARSAGQECPEGWLSEGDLWKENGGQVVRPVWKADVGARQVRKKIFFGCIYFFLFYRMMVDIGAPIRHDMTDEEFRIVFGLWRFLPYEQ